MFRYSLLPIVFVSSTKSLYTVDILLLQPFTSSQEVGYDRGVIACRGVPVVGALRVQIALLHSTVNLWAEGLVEGINHIARKIVRYTLLLLGHGDIKLLVYSTGLAAMLNLALNLLLIPPYGMYGAAVGTSIGYGSMVAFHNWAAGMMGVHPLRNIRLIRVSAMALVTASVVIYIDSVLPSDALSRRRSAAVRPMP